MRLLSLALILELFAAGRLLPAQNLVPPEAFDSQRFTISQLLALNEGQNPPGRVLSISDGLFDPGDRAALESRWFDLSPESLHNAFVTVKQRELLAPNLPLLYGIPSIDGFDGGLLPTSYYTAFMSLMLPEGELRTIDGRLRESMASEACRGACIPDQRWLDLTNTRWLVLDKVYDLVHDGIFYDTGIPVTVQMSQPAYYSLINYFAANEIRIVYRCIEEPCVHPQLRVRTAYEGLQQIDAESLIDLENDYHIIRGELDGLLNVYQFLIIAVNEITVDAVTVIDTRTGDFQQLTPDGWRRVLSSDVKVYENLSVFPRATMVFNNIWMPDTDIGTEMTLEAIEYYIYEGNEPVFLAGEGENISGTREPYTVTFAEYTPERVVIDVTTAADGYLLLTDAYYPGWEATIDGEPTPIYRADVMFRAVFVPEGMHEIIFTYNP